MASSSFPKLKCSFPTFFMDALWFTKFYTKKKKKDFMPVLFHQIGGNCIFLWQAAKKVPNDYSFCVIWQQTTGLFFRLKFFFKCFNKNHILLKMTRLTNRTENDWKSHWFPINKPGELGPLQRLKDSLGRYKEMWAAKTFVQSKLCWTFTCLTANSKMFIQIFRAFSA